MPTWDASSFRSVTMTFTLTRATAGDTAVETGTLRVVINESECLCYNDSLWTSIVPNVAFIGAISGGTAYLTYTTTSTGYNATLSIQSVEYGVV